MITLGKKQSLIILKKKTFGVYLGTSQEEAKDSVLLPIKQVPKDAMIGDSVEVFIYRDSMDRLIATTNEPLIKMGEAAVLLVNR